MLTNTGKRNIIIMLILLVLLITCYIMRYNYLDQLAHDNPGVQVSYMKDGMVKILIILSEIWAAATFAIFVFENTNGLAKRHIQTAPDLLADTLNVFIGFIDAKDPYTAGHSTRVAQYSALIGKELHYSKDKLFRLHYCAILHDCGKLKIPDDILTKPGKLEDDELFMMRCHTTQGFEILRGLTSIPEAAETARYHHERFDGKGYPDGLKGTDIPEFARIVAVVDAFDAMNSSRCYRKTLNKEEIMHQLEAGKETQFDPKLAQILIDQIKAGNIKINAV